MNFPPELARKPTGHASVGSNDRSNKAPVITKGYNMIEIQIPKKTNFNLPRGNYAARITGLKVIQKQSAKGPEDWVRFLFQVTIPGMEKFDTRAGRSFKMNLNNGSELRNFLTSYLGNLFFINGSGQAYNLENLIDRECELKLEHQHSKDYEEPLVVVAGIYPKGCMKLTQPNSEGGKA